MDVHLESPMDAIAEACNAKLPDGLRVVTVVAIDDATPKLASDIAAASLEVTVTAADAALAPRGGGAAGAASIHAVIADRFLTTPDADSGEPRIVEAEVVQKEDTLRIRYTSTMQSQRIVTPEALVSATIGDPASFRVPIKVLRTAQYVARDGRFLSPVDEGVVQTIV
jgi:hypothetical protein